MMSENALVIYKNKLAIVKDRSDGKITILLKDGTQVKVRDKDVEVIHPGPCPIEDFSSIKDGSPDVSVVREAWELLSGEDSPLSLKDLATLISNEYTPSSACAAYFALKDGLYFSGSVAAITPRDKDEVASAEAKRGDKQRETDERVQFLERLKACLKKPAENPMPPNDARFIQDVEALAYGKSTKSKTMKELGLGETPEDAHSLLLKTGFWTEMVNPHPVRFGFSLSCVTICPDPPSAEDRRDLCYLTAFAIDNPWSNDPDDAVSIEKAEDSPGRTVLYVHVADPASSIAFDSPVEKEARDRGATLYLPEGTFRMLAEEALPIFALGLSEKSLALTFKLIIDENGSVIDTEIFPSVVKVQRITYEEADREIDTGTSASADTLRSLYELTQKIFKRRIAQGAVNIDLPGVHITVEDGTVKIEPEISYRSASLVRECMIAAGEGAGTWAASRGLAFPYISQEVDIQGKVPDGLAGFWQLRRFMRPRVISAKPGHHQGLGLDTYTQVTSPLRRYTDLLSHIQIRSFLRGDKLLSADEISARIGFSEAGTSSAVQAERASCNHWIMVYLSDKKDSVWDAVALEKKGSRWAVIIPSLALETQVVLQKDVAPNEKIKLTLKSVNIVKTEAVFANSN
ncbi:MAG: RNB domain-containing ribonuclease [Treponema sp.]|jgi:exoribonuclease-2|nr:RNB domain-containing ribonuclease [Treponema sp.]